MRYKSFAAALGALLLLASLFLLYQRRPVEERPNIARPDGVPARTQAGAGEPDAVAERSDDVVREPASIDLRDASQTFRNSTLLFAIRRAGFYCVEVVSARESANGVWVASCSDMLGYIVTVQGAEQFDVHPVAQYFDSVAPHLVERDRPVDPGSLDPQPK